MVNWRCTCDDFDHINEETDAAFELAADMAHTDYEDLEPVSLSEHHPPEEDYDEEEQPIPLRPAGFGMAHLKAYKSHWLACFCVGLLVAVVLLVVALSNRPPDAPYLWFRDPMGSWGWTIVEKAHGTRLAHYENQKVAPGIVTVQGWWNTHHLFTLWLNGLTNTAQLHDTDTDRCYEMGTVEIDIKAGEGYKMLYEEAEVVQQPFPNNLPASIFYPPDRNNPDTVPEECVIKTWPVEDHAEKERPWPSLLEASGVRGEAPGVLLQADQGLLHFTVPTDDDSYAVKLQTTQIGGDFVEFDRSSYDMALATTKFDLHTGTLVFAQNESSWPFIGDPADDVLASCAGVRLQLGAEHPIFKACVRMVVCAELKTQHPPQGAVNLSQSCLYSQTDRPCECLNEMAGSLMVASVNQCGLCTSESSASCTCWAWARLLSLVAQYAPCHHVDEMADHRPYFEEPERLTYVCGYQKLCSYRLTKECTNVARLCTLVPRAPVYHCFSTTYDYLVHFGLAPNIL